MSGYIPPIQRVDRPIVNSPVQTVSKYASYPYRQHENQLASNRADDWNRVYQQAAESAAEWFKLANHTQNEIDHLIINYNLHTSINNPSEHSLSTLTNKLAELINSLESKYYEHYDHLKPELWRSVENALKHPAAAVLGLQRNDTDGEWTTDYQTSSSKEPNSLNPIHPFAASERQIRQLLLGVDGLLTGLKNSLSYTDQPRAVDLVQSHLTPTLPYIAYYNSVQSYSPLPFTGYIINQYL